jgi:glycosyltransferase involved in cell wall biosynthesis
MTEWSVIDEAQTQGERGVPVVVVAIPCYNEAITIGNVVRAFRATLPQAGVHVFDNNSTDNSVELAREAGAVIHHVYAQGKGNVVQAILATLEADALILTDGDDTYLAEDAPLLLEPILQGRADMVVGNRLQEASGESLHWIRRLGNYLILGGINRMFGAKCKDILSGYRVFSRRFMESVPLLTSGFEIETEIVARSMALQMRVVELPISYRSRPAGSESKLRAFHDGSRIMATALSLLVSLFPMRAFGFASVLFLLSALVIGLFMGVGIVSASSALLAGLLCTFIGLSALALGAGAWLQAINLRFREQAQVRRRAADRESI